MCDEVVLGAVPALAESDKSNVDANIASASDDTVLEEATFKDDNFYMKDLTERCELKAHEWDQRSSMRAGEVTALGKAIDVIKTEQKPTSRRTSVP